MKTPKRIVVVGRAGAGKTTIALRLGAALGLPVTHLDALFWTADWQEVDREVFEAAQRAAIEADEWIIEGGYQRSRGWPDRLRRAELVVVAEAPLVVCLWRVLRRTALGGEARPDRPAQGRERISIYFLWWLVTWSRRHPHLAESLVAANPGARVVVVKRAADLDAILAMKNAPSGRADGA